MIYCSQKTVRTAGSAIHVLKVGPVFWWNVWKFIAKFLLQVNQHGCRIGPFEPLPAKLGWVYDQKTQNKHGFSLFQGIPLNLCQTTLWESCWTWEIPVEHVSAQSYGIVGIDVHKRLSCQKKLPHKAHQMKTRESHSQSHETKPWKHDGLMSVFHIQYYTLIKNNIYIYIYMIPVRGSLPPPEGEKFPVIALVYQHRRSASALFLWLLASAKSWAKRCQGHTFVRFSYTVKWSDKLYK